MKSSEFRVQSSGFEAGGTGYKVNSALRTSNSALPRRGFSLVELLVVIAVLATLATLTIGGVLKAMKQVRRNRADAMCTSLRLAIDGYRAQEGRWPIKDGFHLEPRKINCEKDIPFEKEDDGADITEKINAVVFLETKNYIIFDPLIFRGGNKKSYYLSPSEFMTKPLTRVNVPNKKRKTSIMSLREALDGGATSCPLGHADPDDIKKPFKYFWVEFNLLTDSVTVMPHYKLDGWRERVYKREQEDGS